MCRYFPRTATAAVVDTFSPALANVAARQCFDGVLLLRLFLPRYARVSDLPGGTRTLDSWLATWRSIDNCAQWDSLWLAIFTRLLRHSGLVLPVVAAAQMSSGASPSPRVEPGSSGAEFDAKEWLLGHLPFLFSRVQVCSTVSFSAPRSSCVLSCSLARWRR
jgi:hypothetical protein